MDRHDSDHSHSYRAKNAQRGHRQLLMFSTGTIFGLVPFYAWRLACGTGEGRLLNAT